MTGGTVAYMLRGMEGIPPDLAESIRQFDLKFDVLTSEHQRLTLHLEHANRKIEDLQSENEHLKSQLKKIQLDNKP